MTCIMTRRGWQQLQPHCTHDVYVLAEYNEVTREYEASKSPSAVTRYSHTTTSIEATHDSSALPVLWDSQRNREYRFNF